MAVPWCWGPRVTLSGHPAPLICSSLLLVCRGYSISLALTPVFQPAGKEGKKEIMPPPSKVMT